MKNIKPDHQSFHNSNEQSKSQLDPTGFSSDETLQVLIYSSFLSNDFAFQRRVIMKQLMKIVN